MLKKTILAEFKHVIHVQLLADIPVQFADEVVFENANGSSVTLANLTHPLGEFLITHDADQLAEQITKLETRFC